MAEGTQTVEQQAAETPSRFEVGGKLYSLQEAQDLISRADKFKADAEQAAAEREQLNKFKADVAAAYNVGDTEAYRRLMKELGKPDDQINRSIEMMHRLKGGELNQRPMADEEEEEDVSGHAGRNGNGNGNGRIPQNERQAIVQEVLKQVSDRIGPDFNKLMGWADRVSKVVKPLAEHRTDQELSDRLANDPIVGNVMKMGGKKVELVKRLTKQRLNELIASRGNAGNAEYESAVATARELSDQVGLLDSPERGARAAPTLGSPQQTVGGAASRPAGNRKQKLPNMMSPGYQREVAEMLNSFIAS